MPEQLLDWMDPRFADFVLAKHPAPISPETGEKLWESGIRLHGAQDAIVKDRYRYKKVDGGWRGGKSVVASICLYLDGVWRELESNALDDIYGIIGDSYKMAEEEMRHLDRLLTEGGIPHEFTTPQNQSWRITFPHKKTEYHTLTAADVSKIAARPYRAIVIAEAAQTVYEAWINSRGRVLQSRGWVLMEGTFENQRGPWYAQLSEQWMRSDAMGKRYALPTWDNLVIFPGGRQDPEIVAAESGPNAFPPAVFLEKFGGEPQRPSNVVLPEATQPYTIHRRFPTLGTSFDDERPVFLAIDPGIAHAYAVLALQFYPSDEYLATVKPDQQYGPIGTPPGNVAQVIDVIYRWGRETEQIAEEVVRRPWARNVSDAVLDFAARQRRAEGSPVIEQWAKYWRRDMNAPLWCHADQVPLIAGYEVHRRALLNAWSEEAAQLAFNREGKLGRVTNAAGPRLYIDPDCAQAFFGGMVDGQQYAGEYNLHTNRRDRQGTVTRDEPIDTNNDAIKALSYILYWWFGPARTKHRYLTMTSQPFEVL
jgi:hypothetical protein